MRNMLLLLFVCGGFLFSVNNVHAIVSGDLPGKTDPFWGVMAILQTPDDPDCVDEATDVLTSFSVADPGDRAIQTCAAIALVMNMEDTMEADGIDTNLFDFDDWHHMTGLYFATSFGRIEFTNQIDFMSHDFLVFLQTIMDRMDMNTGEIGLDADLVNGFRNAGAVITMYDVPTFNRVEILVDGDQDDGNIVSGIVYDKVNHTIRFNAEHFTTFTATEYGSHRTAERAKIHSVKAQRFISEGGKERLMLVIKGDDFDNDADVKLGSRKAYKVTRKSDKKLIAYFRMSDLDHVPNPAYVKVINDDAPSKKFKKKIYWRSIPFTLFADLTK